MLLQEYETTVVIRPDIGGDAVEATLDKLRDAVGQKGGKLLAIEHWGKKRLAYEIKKHTRGIYVHTNYLGAQDLVGEVERNLRISDNVLRYLTVKLEDGVDPGTRDEQSYVRPEYDAEESAPEEGSDDNGAAFAADDKAAGDKAAGDKAADDKAADDKAAESAQGAEPAPTPEPSAAAAGDAHEENTNADAEDAASDAEVADAKKDSED